MPEHIPFFRVFLSSPSDVNDERRAVLEVLERLPNRPAFREKVGFRVVAWDKPGADTPMLATMSPQAAIDAGLPRPSECDIVVCILWSRLGTPFTMDGVDYLSGTYYELLDALKSKRAETLIYRRTEKKLFDPSDASGQEQYNRVQTFFDGELFYDPETKQIRRGINHYGSPADFREKFETHLEELVVRLLKRTETLPALPVETSVALPSNVLKIEARRWEGSPFPGLRSFTREDALIFFGRERETDALVKLIAESRFVAVVGASGSGKSSLVGAGLIPRLEANAISSETTGSKDWHVVEFTPGQGDHPFAALFDAMVRTFDTLRPAPFEIRRVKNQFVQDVIADPLTVYDTLTAALEGEKAPKWAEVLVFIDQFEELFTLTKADSIAPFARLLRVLAQQPRVRIVITVRHDFVYRAIEVPEMAELLQSGFFSLAAPTPVALEQMIKRPAEIAALEIEDGLAEQILAHMGTDAGALALMAYTLDELYKVAVARQDRRITFDDYNTIGGVQGSIGERAEQTFQSLQLERKEILFSQVFRELVEVDERGIATRQRTSQAHFQQESLIFVRAFTDARLLVMDETEVEVAHEALFRSWERLKTWIGVVQEDLILLRQVRNAAREWEKKGRDKTYLWLHERLEPVTQMIHRLKPELSPLINDFIRPESERLIAEIHLDETTHLRRAYIGDRLVEIGDPRRGIGLLTDGTPDIEWCFVPGGTIHILGREEPHVLRNYYISKYPVTHIQFESFLQADDGLNAIRAAEPGTSLYRQRQFLEKDDGKGKQPFIATPANCPAINVTWREAVVFSIWLNNRRKKLNLHVDNIPESWIIRLPTEAEWIVAANKGDEGTEYPWGNTWIPNFANTYESRLGRTTAVGMYPRGASWVGTMDMCGNVWEWAINDWYWQRRQMNYAGVFKSIRGAANSPTFDGFDLSFMGFRLAIAHQI
jgi:energy-coupling factor transporter ATP-binding protein EcfA2